jgi:GNAT superfamily N-acetyltransferase
MIVRLHNLAMRAPGMADLGAIAALISACDEMEAGGVDIHEQEERLRQLWLASGFHLLHDAWVIVSSKVQVVAYASVHLQEEAVLSLQLYVHPQYRNRGIGTLLIWLAEERARQLMRDIRPELCVCLRMTVHNENQVAMSLCEREGYRVVHDFWRLIVEMDETLVRSFCKPCQGGKVKLDVVVDARQAEVASRSAAHSSAYSAHHYLVYEKQLRAGCIILEDMREADLLACQ